MGFDGKIADFQLGWAPQKIFSEEIGDVLFFGLLFYRRKKQNALVSF